MMLSSMVSHSVSMNWKMESADTCGRLLASLAVMCFVFNGTLP